MVTWESFAAMLDLMAPMMSGAPEAKQKAFAELVAATGERQSIDNYRKKMGEMEDDEAVHGTAARGKARGHRS